MEQLSPRQTNAVQVGIGMTIAGLVLLILSIINLNAARKLGPNVSESPEPIALDQLLARGLEGNPNVWVRDMKVGEKCVGIHRTELGSTTYQYVLMPIEPTNRPTPPGTILALVRNKDVGSEIALQRLTTSTSIRGMIVNRVTQLSSKEIELLRKEYPQTDFTQVLLIDADKAPPWRYWGVASGAGIVVLLLGALILVLAFVNPFSGKRKRKRKRRRRDFDEDE